jgi:hypothetical protein
MVTASYTIIIMIKMCTIHDGAHIVGGKHDKKKAILAMQPFMIWTLHKEKNSSQYNIEIE